MMAISILQVHRMFCTSCGAGLSEEAKFCQKCGVRVGKLLHFVLFEFGSLSCWGHLLPQVDEAKIEMQMLQRLELFYFWWLFD